MEQDQVGKNHFLKRELLYHRQANPGKTRKDRSSKSKSVVSWSIAEGATPRPLTLKKFVHTRKALAVRDEV